MWQALRLGAGWGISSEPCDDGYWTEQTWRVFEAVDYRWSGDPEPVARLGQLVGRHVDSGGQDRIADDDALFTGWFRDAVLELLPQPGFGDWNDVLLRACHGPGGGRTGVQARQSRGLPVAASLACAACGSRRTRRSRCPIHRSEECAPPGAWDGIAAWNATYEALASHADASWPPSQRIASQSDDGVSRLLRFRGGRRGRVRGGRRRAP